MFVDVLAFLLAVPFVVQVLAQNQCSRMHTVQAGDYCDSISAHQNVSTYQLAVVNENIINEDCTNLQPGQPLCLGWVGNDCDQTYVVNYNDDCESVAYGAGINVTTLYNNNPQIDSTCGNLYVGEVVCVSSNVQVPPAPSGSMPATAIPSTAYPATTSLPWCD